jgi:ABC-type dipeptide/oligopeptide/nickel transport system ATPase component
VAEPAFYHQHVRGRSLRQRVRDLLQAVRIPSPEVRMREYPHQMSGGMRQRVVRAIAMAGGPKLIIADEPTTNLDVTIQAQYLEVLKEIQRESGVALIFVTYNLGIVAKMCDRMAVMYAGKIVEQGSVRNLFRSALCQRHCLSSRICKNTLRSGPGACCGGKSAGSRRWTVSISRSCRARPWG